MCDIVLLLIQNKDPFKSTSISSFDAKLHQPWAIALCSNSSSAQDLQQMLMSTLVHQEQERPLRHLKQNFNKVIIFLARRLCRPAIKSKSNYK